MEEVEPLMLNEEDDEELDKMFWVDRLFHLSKIFVVGQEFSHACQTVDMTGGCLFDR